MQAKLPLGPQIWDIPPNSCGDGQAERRMFLTRYFTPLQICTVN